MEFIKAFEEAKKLGITKEEFLPIWEIESRKRHLDGGNEAMLLPRDLDRNQSESSDYQSTTNKFSQPWQQIKDELHQELHVRLQHMFNDMIEKQELQWKQLWLKNDQHWNEALNYFGILNTHISNASDTLTHSLRLFLLQEMSLLEQELKKMIKSQSTEQESLKAPLKQVGLQNYQGPCEGPNYFPKESTTIGKEAETVFQSQQNVDAKSRSLQQKQVKKQLMRLPDPASEVCVDEQKRKLPSKDLQYTAADSFSREQGTGPGETQQIGHLQPNSSLLPDFLNSGKKASDDKSSKGSSASSISSSSVSATEASIQATGSYAEAISKQMKAQALTNASKSNSAVSEKEHSRSFYNKTGAHASSLCHGSNAGTSEGHNLIKFFPTENIILKINNIDVFAISHQKHTTPFYYTKSKACKGQLCLWFNEKFQLSVAIIVANGLNDNSAKWPIRFTSTGFIYNDSSHTPSQIWALGPIDCSKPEPGKEITLRAAINLRTIRSSTPDITYQAICGKGYDLGHTLCFHWNLIASEK